jgi:hypothetical protein
VRVVVSPSFIGVPLPGGIVSNQLLRDSRPRAWGGDPTGTNSRTRPIGTICSSPTASTARPADPLIRPRPGGTPPARLAMRSSVGVVRDGSTSAAGSAGGPPTSGTRTSVRRSIGSVSIGPGVGGPAGVRWGKLELLFGSKGGGGLCVRGSWGGMEIDVVHLRGWGSG